MKYVIYFLLFVSSKETVVVHVRFYLVSCTLVVKRDYREIKLVSGQ